MRFSDFEEMDDLFLSGNISGATSAPANFNFPHFQSNLNNLPSFGHVAIPHPSDQCYTPSFSPLYNLSLSDPAPGSGACADLDDDLLIKLRSMQIRDTGFGSIPASPNLDLYQSLLYRTNGFVPSLRYGSRPVRAEETVILPSQHFRSLQYLNPYPNPNPYAVRNGGEYIYRLAKQQNGCRFLQRKFDEGTRKEIDNIFLGLIDHVVELMMDPFGNYLIQKLLEVCSEEQKTKVVAMVCRNVMRLIRVCLNNHGTRAMQKLIETLKTQQQIAMVVTALKPGFLDLIKDLNGNHVIQRCLQCLPNEDNKFIFEASAMHCVDIATHQHGCCVLQRCINYAPKEHRAKLTKEISANGLHLAQDAFGNYVVQYTLQLKDPSANAMFMTQFQGHYVNLSMQKFSSNVVEKCLKLFPEVHQRAIVYELLRYPRFDQLLQDPFANYVIQRALESTKGTTHAMLLDAIKPHAPILPTSPYSKKIAKIC